MPGLLVVFLALVAGLCVFIVGAHVALARWSRGSRVVEFGEQLGSCCAACGFNEPSPMAEFSECGCGCTEWCTPAGAWREPNESDRHDDRLWS